MSPWAKERAAGAPLALFPISRRNSRPAFGPDTAAETSQGGFSDAWRGSGFSVADGVHNVFWLVLRAFAVFKAFRVPPPINSTPVDGSTHMTRKP